jgi:hypothetical protein
MARHKEARDKSQIAGRGVASAGLVFVPPVSGLQPFARPVPEPALAVLAGRKTKIACKTLTIRNISGGLPQALRMVQTCDCKFHLMK